MADQLTRSGPVAPESDVEFTDPVGYLGRTRPQLLARAVADLLVIAADEQARAASPTYWSHSESGRAEVLAAAAALTEPGLRGLIDSLLDEPTSVTGYHQLREALTRSASRPGESDALFRTAWRVDSMARMGYHAGTGYQPDAVDLPWAQLVSTDEHTAAIGAVPAVLVVIPFRDNGSESRRIRNALACLRALRDQSLPRHAYHLALVEADSTSRWRDSLEPLVDSYHFAPDGGAFNKAWTVNVGVVNTPVPADLMCVLDADILVDRDFLARNAARFRTPGMGALLPYRDVLYLDEPASRRAITQRVVAGAAEADADLLRGFPLRAPSGGCIWLRTAWFHRIGGFDERFEGWGGEDDNFAIRLNLWAGLHRFGDTLLHLAHPPAQAQLTDGVPTNGPKSQLRPTWPIGDIDRRRPTEPAER